MSLLTASREKEDMEAIFPVEKKPDWSRKRKNREMRASERLRLRKEPCWRELSRSLAAASAGVRGSSSEIGFFGTPFVEAGASLEEKEELVEGVELR